MKEMRMGPWQMAGAALVAVGTALMVWAKGRLAGEAVEVCFRSGMRYSLESAVSAVSLPEVEEVRSLVMKMERAASRGHQAISAHQRFGCCPQVKDQADHFRAIVLDHLMLLLGRVLERLDCSRLALQGLQGQSGIIHC